MNRIKLLRKKIGLTQINLAHEIGVTQACIAAWETEKAKPAIDKIPKLAEALHCKISDLFENG